MIYLTIRVALVDGLAPNSCQVIIWTNIGSLTQIYVMRPHFACLFTNCIVFYFSFNYEFAVILEGTYMSYNVNSILIVFDDKVSLCLANHSCHSRVRDVVTGRITTIVRTYSPFPEYFGRYNGTSYKSIQAARGMMHGRDVLAKSYNGQESWGPVKLDCRSNGI